MAHIISYDLNKPKQDYKGLYEQIKSLGVWWHYLDSTWIVKSNLSAENIFSRLNQHIDTNDRILIIEVTKKYSGWLPEDAWKWIHENA